MDRHLAMIKLVAEAGGAAASGVVGVLAVGESSSLTAAAIVAVLGFAGLLVRQVVAGQRAIWEIVAAKDRELVERDDTVHYLRWELEALRYRHGERAVDPGPYVPRRPPSGKDADHG